MTYDHNKAMRERWQNLLRCFQEFDREMRRMNVSMPISVHQRYVKLDEASREIAKPGAWEWLQLAERPALPTDANR